MPENKLLAFVGLVFTGLLAGAGICSNMASSETGAEADRLNGYALRLVIVAAAVVIAYFVVPVLFSLFGWAQDWATFRINTKRAALQAKTPALLAGGHQPTLEIVDASYGTHEHNVNVTEILQSKVEGNRLVLTANHDQLGIADPAQSQFKTLWVKYRVDGGEEKGASWTEGGGVDLPPREATDTAPAPTGERSAPW